MRITIIAVGTRGDIQPFLALGHGLRSHGYRVRMATHEPYENECRRLELEFVAMAGNPRTAFADVRRGLTEGRAGPLGNRIAGLRYLRRQFPAMAGLASQFLADCQRACAGAQALICSPLAFAGPSVAERLGLPSLFGTIAPLTRTRAFPMIGFPPISLGPRYNLLTYALAQRLVWAVTRPMVNWTRGELGLPPLTFRSVREQLQGPAHPWLYSFSPAVVPKPADWGEHIHVTGYWFLDRSAGWQPPPELRRFLDDGPPPVYVGFGSMPTADPEATTRLVLRALARTGSRGLLAEGWAGLGQSALPDTVLRIGDTPHDWLFPRVAAVVHHGGSGTTGAGLRAGAPSVITPIFSDQPYWGRRVHELGVGPRPIPWRRMTEARLAAAIATATADAAVRARATALGARIRAEDGVARAVDVVQQHLGRPVATPTGHPT